jgi:AraC family ethanolamine operon transcriptional activator
LYDEFLFFKLFQATSAMRTIKSENRNLATIESDNRRRLMLLQTLRTRDFDELAGAFPRWNLRFRQFGRGPYRGHAQFLQLGRIQVFRVAVNRMIHIEGWSPPGSFGCIPVLAANENAVWGGRRLKAGQIRVFDPGQAADHMTAAAHYQLVSLVVDGELFRQEMPLLGGFDQEECLVAKEVVTTSPAYCRALSSHLAGLFEQAQAQPDLLAQSGRLVEQECLRRFADLLGRPNDDRTACQPPNRSRVVRRAEEFMRAHWRDPLSMLDLCRELGVSERTLQYAFQEVRGLSPMAYCKASRLNAVRQELTATTAGTTTVREIAQRWGFWHTGEFAADYRRLFGELPSQTFNR